MKISVCGKGGSGKSTVVALLAKAAQQRELSVVIVDSDESNSSLFKMLGFEYPPAPLPEMAGGKASLKEKMKSSEVLSRSKNILTLKVHQPTQGGRSNGSRKKIHGRKGT